MGNLVTSVVAAIHFPKPIKPPKHSKHLSFPSSAIPFGLAKVVNSTSSGVTSDTAND